MNLLQRNNLWLGMALAMLFPVMVYGVVLMLFEMGTNAGMIDEVADPMGGKRLRTTTLITLCGNAILIKLFNRRFTQETLRGILIVTFIGAAVWLGVFYDEVLSAF